MQNGTDPADDGGRLHGAIDNDREETVGKPSQPCPIGTAWCGDHQDPDEDGGWCSTGSIMVTGLDGIGVSIENSWGQPKLYGLAVAEADCLNMQGARELRDALATLVGKVDQ